MGMGEEEEAVGQGIWNKLLDLMEEAGVNGDAVELL
jgi:hypothetical protein